MTIFREPCRVCGGAPFRCLGCPILNRITFRVAVFFGAVTVVLTVSWALGGPVGNVALGLLLAAFFAGYSLISRRRASLDKHPPRH